jgi:hypothetical protein
MARKQMWTAIALIAVFAWSVVMAALGQVTAIATLVPSLGLLIQQIVHSTTTPQPGQTSVPPPPAGRDEGRA